MEGTLLMSGFAPEMEINHTKDNNHQIVQFLNSSNNTSITHQVFVPCNNPHNIIDRATAARVETVIQIVILPLLEIFGVTTNVINCVVFTRQGLKDRINLCLFCLALADSSFLMLMFSAKFHSFLGLFDKELEEYWKARYLGTVLGPMMGAMTISNLMTMIISLERCICVLAPFKAKRFLQTRYMAIMVAILAVYVMGIYSLLNMKYVTLRVTDPVTNTSRWVSRLSTFYVQNRREIDIVYNYLLTLTVQSLSLVVMVVATATTVNRLRTTLAWRQDNVNVKSTLGDKRETAVTKMLAVICFIYMATITPSVTQGFFRALVPGYTPAGKYCNIFWILQNVAYFLEVTNSSVNFIVYFTMGSRYRQTLRQLFGTTATHITETSASDHPLQH